MSSAGGSFLVCIKGGWLFGGVFRFGYFESLDDFLWSFEVFNHFAGVCLGVLGFERSGLGWFCIFGSASFGVVGWKGWVWGNFLMGHAEAITCFFCSW